VVVDRVINREVELGVAYEQVVNAEVETEVLIRSGIACVLRHDHPLATCREIGCSPCPRSAATPP